MSNLLKAARKQLDIAERDHRLIVSKASGDVRDSRKKLDAARKRVRDLEFAAVELEIYMEQERRAGRVR